MPKSIAGAYAIAGSAIAIAIIVVAGSTVGLFGARPTTAPAEAAAQPTVTQASQALDFASAGAEGAPVGAAALGARGEREHEEREHAERGSAERTGFLGFLRNGDD